ncbi:phage scaffolding protein [Paenibacillus alvei]|uniref:phage scaffolding protein n=1 Tax=Paenibacillus alvei TaxID=44250 RepID=UPI000288EB40|nr:phage scaffolding protein [Paenibacillus alvei]EJW16991.1 phage minor structural protein GP20 [Paenibacillus alvei DSM 29]MCY9539104.1 phage scaffolding protein [Paenibacillus alvei]MCY9707971.1 phage scaffolding protein [Paenibacillus alvei]MCY9736702.1 phage scaffolding protein [Paenibacillus alvei]MCY9753612.1 phage scaffolding protein [Paenibacillus alvei]
MNKEQFISLGFTEEQAEKAAAASQEELKGFVPKSRFDEVNEAKKKAEKDASDRDKQIEELGKTAGVSEELKKQIETLTAANKEAAEKHAAELKELTLTNAISAALNGKVHNEKVVTGLINREKLVVGDDGKIVGLEEQLTKLKTSDAYLFKDDTQQQQQTPPGFRVGGDGNPNPPAATASLKDAIAAHFQK